MKKKNVIKICGAVLAMPLMLAGCATVGDVIDPATNKSIYFEDITCFGGSAMQIGDYLYYGNTYTAVSDAQSFDYAGASREGYLARMDISEGLTSDGKAPAGTLETVNGKLAGYNNQYMFAYQNYLYFTSANEHKDSSNKNYYDRVSVFRVKFNGDDMSELFTTRYDESSFIKAVEGSDGNGYIVTYSETEDRSQASSSQNKIYDVSVMKIGDKLGKREVVATNVTSAVVDENKNSKNKDLFYAKASEKGQATTEVYSLDLATGKSKQIETRPASSTTLIAKTNDELFYSYKYSSSGNEVYKTDLNGFGENEMMVIGAETDKFYAYTTIKNVYPVATGNTLFEGYIFVGDSSLMYYNNHTEKATRLLASSGFTDILFVDGNFIYYSTDKSIGRISFKPNTNGEYAPQTLVEMTSIVSGKYAYVNGYIYFYAKYEPVTEYDEDGNEIKYETDESNYMYRIKVGDPEDNVSKYQLVSKNKTMPKIEEEESEE